MSGGYNGGGDLPVYSCCGGHYTTSGGGATHVAFSSGLLQSLENNKSSIIMVAGGGGGALAHIFEDVTYSTLGGSGGGMNGSKGRNGNNTESNWDGFIVGTQTSGYAFGKGGVSSDLARSGGGGGYFGGNVSCGGSGYIGNSLLQSKAMYCYNCTASSNESTKTVSTTNVSQNAIRQYAKIGNGYAKITLVSFTY